VAGSGSTGLRGAGSGAESFSASTISPNGNGGAVGGPGVVGGDRGTQAVPGGSVAVAGSGSTGLRGAGSGAEPFGASTISPNGNGGAVGGPGVVGGDRGAGALLGGAARDTQAGSGGGREWGDCVSAHRLERDPDRADAASAARSTLGDDADVPAWELAAGSASAAVRLLARSRRVAGRMNTSSEPPATAAISASVGPDS
jgi:hypothetical protein